MGIEKIKSIPIFIYPNPVQNELIIDNAELIINRIEIIDLSGKTIYQSIDLKNQIHVSALPQGIYFVKLETEKGIVTKKIVKE